MASIRFLYFMAVSDKRWQSQKIQNITPFISLIVHIQFVEISQLRPASLKIVPFRNQNEQFLIIRLRLLDVRAVIRYKKVIIIDFYC